MRTLTNCQRAKTLLTTFEENNDDGDYIDVEMEEGEEEGFSRSRGFRGREDEKNYDKDPELAEILGSCLDDPDKAQSMVSFFAGSYAF